MSAIATRPAVLPPISLPREAVIDEKIVEFHKILEESQLQVEDLINYEESVKTRQYAQIGTMGKAIIQQLNDVPVGHPLRETVQKIVGVMTDIQNEMSLVLDEWQAANAKIVEQTNAFILEEANKQLASQNIPATEENLQQMVNQIKTTEDGLPIIEACYTKARESSTLFLGNWMALYLQDLNAGNANLETALATGNADNAETAKDQIKTAIANIQKTKQSIDAQKQQGRASPKAEALYQLYESRIEDVDPTGVLRQEVNTWIGYAHANLRIAKKYTPYILPIAAAIGNFIILPNLVHHLVENRFLPALSYFGDEGEKVGKATMIALKAIYAVGIAKSAHHAYKEKNVPFMAFMGFALYSQATDLKSRIIVATQSQPTPAQPKKP